ncbi:MAG: TonB C-terminal domain-containing protein [Chthoniobacterales bacterium]
MMSQATATKSVFQRYRFVIGGVVVVLVITAGFFAFSGKPSKRKSVSTSVAIMLPPPPPPPPQPTPPPPEPPPQQEETKQPEFQAEEQPQSAPEPPAPEPAAAPMGTDIQGNGPADGFGLSGKGGGGLIGGTGNGNGNGNGNSKWGWYAGQVQTRVVDALGKHRKTRSSNINGIKVRIWADTTGRITKVTLSGTTGDKAVDSAIQSEALANIQLQEAPPAGMPMPIVMRISAKRPH